MTSVRVIIASLCVLLSACEREPQTVKIGETWSVSKGCSLVVDRAMARTSDSPGYVTLWIEPWGPSALIGPPRSEGTSEGDARRNNVHERAFRRGDLVIDLDRFPKKAPSREMWRAAVYGSERSLLVHGASEGEVLDVLELVQCTPQSEAAALREPPLVARLLARDGGVVLQLVNVSTRDVLVGAMFPARPNESGHRLYLGDSTRKAEMFEGWQETFDPPDARMPMKVLRAGTLMQRDYTIAEIQAHFMLPPRCGFLTYAYRLDGTYARAARPLKLCDGRLAGVTR